jgi:hypothetical protein
LARGHRDASPRLHRQNKEMTMNDSAPLAARAPRPPRWWQLGWEAHLALEAAAALGRASELRHLPGGDGHTVIVLPGFAADNSSTTVLRSNLRRLSYDPRGWNDGMHRGDMERVLLAAGRLAGAAAAPGGCVSLVGWSFGGVIAREAARLDPSAVRRVVTLGTPVVGGPKYTRVARWLRRSGHDVDAIERAVEELNRTPLTVPVTAVYSKTDGVVDWRACIDPWNPTVEHVEVRSSHLGMGHNPAVLEVVARRLAMAAAPA